MQKKNFKQLKELSIKMLTDTTYLVDEERKLTLTVTYLSLVNFIKLPFGQQELLLQEAFQTDVNGITKEIITIIESLGYSSYY